ncbi:MAG: hypothetical protein ABSG78_23125 [Verrucomicrobiota bacterium]
MIYRLLRILAKYTVNVLLPGTYTVEARVAGIGTNVGGVFQCDFTNGCGVLSNSGGISNSTGRLTNTTTNWTDVSAVVYLPNGTNVMTLQCLANGSDGSHVGRFNYISIYPWWPGPLQTNVSTNVPHLISDDDSWYTSSNNAYWIQYVINGFSNGGVVSIPSGTYYVAQLSTNDVSAAYASSAMSVVANNVIIEGAGVGAGVSNTTLIAHNRATTIFSFGQNALQYNPLCTNLTLRDMTLVARPHLVFTNILSVNTNMYERGQLYDDRTGRATGTLVEFYGNYTADPWQYTQNILVSNCVFLHAIQSLGLYAAVSNCLVRECTFIPWDLTNSFDGTTNTPPGEIPTAYTTGYAGQEVGIMGGGNNIVIVENTYNNIGTATNTNNFQTSAPDGFVWLQSGGNAFIGRNLIGNYALEGIQLDAGPTAVVGNTYCTVVSCYSACALSAGGTKQAGLTGTSNDYATCFIGNWVHGGRNGECWTAAPGPNARPFTLNFSGNYLNVFPPFNEVGDHPGGAVTVSVCQSANIFGNTLAMGSCGVLFGANCTNGVVLNNDFGNVTYGGICLAWGIVASPSLQNAQIFRNILGKGLTFHTQVSYPYSFDWFLNQNQYVNGAMSVPPFLDPAASAAHVSN